MEQRSVAVFLSRSFILGLSRSFTSLLYSLLSMQYCETVEDFLARRIRLLFLDTMAAREAIPRVAELMGKEKGWSDARTKEEVARAEELLRTFDSTEMRNMGNVNADPVNA